MSTTYVGNFVLRAWYSIIQVTPSIVTGATTASPASANTYGLDTTTISCAFSDTDATDENSFTVTFKVRDASSVEYTLVDAKTNGNGGLVVTNDGGGSYTASYVWDPGDAMPAGLYDLYCSVTDETALTATDGYDNNADELTLTANTVTITDSYTNTGDTSASLTNTGDITGTFTNTITTSEAFTNGA